MAGTQANKTQASKSDSSKSDTSKSDASKAHENPKTDPKDVSNQIKDPSEWTTGGEPMTGAQASYLKTLSEEAKDPDAFDPDLDKAEASQRIDALRKESGKA
ncbi:hypothetical protein ASG63_17905 [Methylobacterium sp. Leaf94]|uniref:DUF3072 domain-containing protein n=1 Tax=Methylobacterium sp. Leaf94 TaxID=1736250 RepID=UPI0006F98E14|nr:DUF3072 domain-containing protein [Methylobacterium sp. Leaf94]KQU28892.1 hypothetical protein ASG63_17905 [Methylobacterium sp. Leaf94]